MSLEEAWKESCKHWKRGWEMIQQAEANFKDASKMPVNGRISFWLAGTEACVLAIQDKTRGYEERLKGDDIWHRAVIQVKGDIKVRWLQKPEGFQCTFETGEVFEPL
jgi:hypothetical protein